MNKKEICMNNESFAYWSGLGGLEFKKIEYGVNDYIYCVSGAWCSKKSYHRLKMYYNPKKDDYYIKLKGYRIYFNECINI